MSLPPVFICVTHQQAVTTDTGQSELLPKSNSHVLFLPDKYRTIQNCSDGGQHEGQKTKQ